MVKVTAAAKMLVEQGNSVLGWPGQLPQAVYNFKVPQLPSGQPLDLGEEFHRCLERHLSGQWVAKEHYYSCSGVAEILSDLGLQKKSLRMELPLRRGSLSGVADLVGLDSADRQCVVEIKTTQGLYALAPQPWELAQLAMYADILEFNHPRLICLRVNFRLGRVSVFFADFHTSVIQDMVKAA